MAENIAEEIRAKETQAREIVAEAKKESARITATARTLAEQSVKEAKQKSHRYFRDQVRETERLALEDAAKTVESGRKEAEAFYDARRKDTAKVADWLIKEVMTTDGAD